MTQTIRRHLLALMLGVTAFTVAMPLAHYSIAYAEDGESGDDDGIRHKLRNGHHSDSDQNHESDEDGDEEDDDDAGPVGATGGAFQEGCNVADAACMNVQPVK